MVWDILVVHNGGGEKPEVLAGNLAAQIVPYTTLVDTVARDLKRHGEHDG